MAGVCLACCRAEPACVTLGRIRRCFFLGFLAFSGFLPRKRVGAATRLESSGALSQLGFAWSVLIPVPHLGLPFREEEEQVKMALLPLSRLRIQTLTSSMTDCLFLSHYLLFFFFPPA